MNFLPGTPLNTEVRTQLELRQGIFGAKDGAKREEYIKLQSRTPWVKMTSAVSLSASHPMAKNRYGAGTKFAQENALFSFINDSDQKMTTESMLTGYRKYEENSLGYRPQPGITAMDIRSHNRFGSLRTATIRFVCWTKDDMDKMELLYMRPGYSVLLEWGYSMYIDGNGKVQSGITTVDYSKLSSATATQTEIDKKKSQYGLSYDGILGLVKNFTWSLRTDGGYDCITTLVTTGELVESYKGNILFDQEKFNADISTEQKNAQTKDPDVVLYPELSYDHIEPPYGEDLNKTRERAELFKRKANDKLKEVQERWLKLLETDTHEYSYTLSEIAYIFGSDENGPLFKLEVVGENTRLHHPKVASSYTSRGGQYGPGSTSYSDENVESQWVLVGGKKPFVEVGTDGNGGKFSINVLPLIVYTSEVDGTVKTADSGLQMYRESVKKAQRAIIKLHEAFKDPTGEQDFNIIGDENVGQLYIKAGGGRSDSPYEYVKQDVAFNGHWDEAPRRVTLGIGSGAEDYYAYRNRVRFLRVEWKTFDEKEEIIKNNVAQSDEPQPEAFPTSELFVSKLNYVLLSEIAMKVQAKSDPKKLAADSKKVSFKDTFSTVDLTGTPAFGSDFINTRDTSTISRYSNILYGKLVNSGALPTTASIHTYVKLGYLLTLINDTLLKSSSERLFEFNVGKGADTSYFTASEHLSIDPSVCILPHTIDTLSSSLSSLESDKILDIQLNIYYISKLIKRHINDRGQIQLLTFLEGLFADIERVTGGVNQLGLQYQEETRMYTIVDRRSFENKKASQYGQIDIYGLSSVVKNVNLVSKLPPRMGSMIAISAQASPFTSIEEASGFDAINKGLTDYTYTTRKDRSILELEQKAAGMSREQQLEVYRGTIKGVLQAIEEWYSAGLISEQQANACGQYQNYMKTIVGSSPDNTHNFIIPFELQLTLDGISKFRVLEAFRVSQELLPHTYGGGNSNIAFVVTGVEHSVNNTDWTTTVKSQIININDNAASSVNTDISKLLEIVGASSAFLEYVKDTPWSAAFISYVAKKTLPLIANISFPFAGAHTTYAQSIRTDAKYGWTALDPATTVLQKGDIIVANREGNRLTFSTSIWAGSSHGDYVVTTSGLQAEIIGGNVGDTVTKRTVCLTGGILDNANEGTDGSYFVVLRPSNYQNQLAQAANEEFVAFGGKKETDPTVSAKLREYYAAGNMYPPQ